MALRTADGERIEAVSWAELFYEGSERYHDLWGWLAWMEDARRPTEEE